MSPGPTKTISAAGGIVVRFISDEPELLVVHRPAYGDWSFPKGKDEPGETPQETAIREVEEETGIRTQIVGELGTTEYRVTSGNKTVHWFVMRAVAGGEPFAPNDEVDEIRWVSPEEANQLLTYAFDRDLLNKAPLEDQRRNGTIYVVRHARAGSRKKWDGDDLLRPLTSRGETESIGIANLLEVAQIERIVSSPAVRCVQTVEPLAQRTGVALETHDALGEDAPSEQTTALIEQLAGSNVVVCTHGDLMPLIVDDMVESDRIDTLNSSWPKGSTWVVTVEDRRLVSSSYLGPPKT